MHRSEELLDAPTSLEQYSRLANWILTFDS